MTIDLWRQPPYPERGDTDPTVIWASVGRALSAWEMFEGHLSQQFAFFVAYGRHSRAARRAYGSVASFTGRRTLLEAAAEVYFTDTAEGALQADFKRQMDTASDASARRSDIAHGTVQPYAFGLNTAPLQGRRFDGYCLVPSTYTSKRRDQPAYAYASVEINALTLRFEAMIPPAELISREIVARR